MKRLFGVLMLALLSTTAPRCIGAQAQSPAEIAVLKKKAAAGDAAAQVSLGDTYYLGEVVPKSMTEAVKWYRLAAAQGNAAAQYNLGTMYDNGEGVPESKTEAVSWFTLAAAHGDASAQYNLGNMYHKGEGVPRDNVQAYKWFSLAAAQGKATAKKTLAVLVTMMTKEQIAEAQRLSTEFKPTKKP